MLHWSALFSLPSSPLGFAGTLSWNLAFTSSDAGRHALYSGLGGASTGIFGIIFHLFCKRPLRNLPTWMVFLLSLTGLIIVLYLCISLLVLRSTALKSTICVTFVETMLGGPDAINPDNVRFLGSELDKCWGTLGYTLQDTDVTDRLDTRLLILQIVLVMISDGAISYRAIALNQKNYIRVMLITICVLCLCSGIIMISIYVYNIAWPGFAASNKLLALRAYWKYAFLGCSILCNLATTSVFGYTLWSHGRFLTVTLGLDGTARVTLSQRILASIVESGVVFCSFQVAYLILTSTLWYQADTLGVFQAVYTGISGMYPALIFLVTNIQTLSCDMGIEGSIGRIRSSTQS